MTNDEPSSPTGRSSPTLHRILRRYFGERIPAALAADAAILWIVYGVVYYAWYCLPTRYFARNQDLESSFIDKVFNASSVLNALLNLAYWAAALVSVWACVRLIAERKQAE